MATYKTPGVYVEEISKLPPSVAEVSTAIPAFIGCTAKGPSPDSSGKVVPIVKRINTLLDYETLFGGPHPSAFTVEQKLDDSALGAITRCTPDPFDYLLYYSLSLYFKNGGGSCYVISIGDYCTAPTKDQFLAGLEALEQEDEPTLILLTDAIKLAKADYYELAKQALAQCNKLGDRFAILDIPDSVEDFRQNIGMENLMYGAAYYPFLETTLTYAYEDAKVTFGPAPQPVAVSSGQSKKMRQAAVADADSVPVSSRLSDIRPATALYNQIKIALGQQRVTLPPSAAVAGVYASVDRDRGVWKAPANVSLAAVIGPTVKITHEDQENMNIDATAGKSINAIRAFTGKGTLLWGARTLAGNDNEWRYISVRRLFNMIEESTQKATAFAVFEPNDATTWLKVKAMIESYLYGLWQQGALAGATPEQAYFVNVGLGKTMTAQDILEGRMIVEMGLAAVRPAEFIILRFMHKLQQA